MPSAKSVLALFSANQGHASIAQAISERLASTFTIKKYSKTILFENAYRLVYRYWPEFFLLPYSLPKLPLFKQLTYWYYLQGNETDVTTFLKENPAQLTLATYFDYNPLLSRFNQEKNLPFVNIIANPRSTHVLEVVPAPSLNVVFDQTQADLCQELLPGSITAVCGWFVKSTFKPLTTLSQKNALKKELGLDPELPVFTFISGTEGNPKIKTLIEFLSAKELPIQIVAICGNNASLKKDLDSLQTRTVKIKVLGFSTEVHRYFQVSDLAIGKAGPNTLFEAVATHTPFMAIEHIPGTETGNLEIITEYQLGFVAENTSLAQEMLLDLIKNPDSLQKLRTPIQKMADYNQTAGDRLQAAITNLLAKQYG